MLAGPEPGIVRRPLRPSAADCGFPPWLRLAAMPSRGRRVLVRFASPRASLESKGGIGKLEAVIISRVPCRGASREIREWQQS